MTLAEKAAIGAGLGVLALFLLRQIGKDATESVGSAVDYVTGTAGAVVDYAGQKLSPYSDKNVLYDNVIGGAGRVITGDASWSLGGQIYDWFH